MSSATVFDLSTLFTNDITKLTKGAVYSGDKSFEASAAAWEKRAVPTWLKSVVNADQLRAKLLEVQALSPVSAGLAEEPYQALIKIIEAAGDLSYSRVTSSAPVSALVVPEQYVKSGDKIVAKVDIAKFQSEMARLTTSVDRVWMKSAVVKQGSEQDFFHLVGQMLTVPESLTLIGILSARLLVGQDDRKVIDGHLEKVTVLQNRTGKLSQGVVRMGGFIGLACCYDVPEIKHFCRFIANPLLGQDAVERPAVQKANETAEAFKLRDDSQKRRFNGYKSVMADMKNQKVDFDRMAQADKAAIKKAVTEYLLG